MYTFAGNTYVSAGGSLMGEVETTRGDLERVFGEPTFDTLSDDGKTTVEWVVQFENGTRATIYDWKRYEEGTPGMDEMYEWHVGGNSFDCVELVMAALDGTLVEDDYEEDN